MDFESVCLAGEKSIEQEIGDLEISQEDKDRILKKLKSMNCNFSKRLAQKENECCEKITKDREKLDRMTEQNLALKNACFALSDALKQETTIK